MAKSHNYQPGENRLIHLNLGKIFSWSPKTRAELLNSNEESTAHNDKMVEAASKEFNDPPLSDTIEKIKAGATDIKDKTVSVFKETIKSPFKLTAHVITKPVEWIGKPTLSVVSGVTKGLIATTSNIVGVAATAPRIAADAARLAARVPLIALDKLSVFFGYPSSLIRYIKEKILSTIDKSNEAIYEISNSTREKIFSTLGATQ